MYFGFGKGNRTICPAVCLLAAVFILAGCGFLKPIERKGAGGERLGNGPGPSPVYYDFDDVLVPGEMKPDRRWSSVFQIDDMTMGVLAFQGKMDPVVVIEFLKINMARDNWRSVSEFKAPRSLLLFEKKNRWCLVTLTDERYGHQIRMDVWVTPKTSELGTGLFK